MLYEERDELETTENYDDEFNPGNNEDFETSISTDSLPYDDDLHVAAFIGKKLLDRNIELEQQLSDTARENEEQAREIQLLARQISELRDTERVRSLTYEQWDVARLQVERENERLASEKQLQYKFISNLQYNVEQLEDKCNSLELELKQVLESQRPHHFNDNTSHHRYLDSGSSPLSPTWAHGSKGRLDDSYFYRRTNSLSNLSSSFLSGCATSNAFFGCDVLPRASCKEAQGLVEGLSKAKFERDKLARQNKVLTEMIEKCEEDIQKHISSVEQLQTRVDVLQPKAEIQETIEQLLTMYVETVEMSNAKNLTVLKQKMYSSLVANNSCNAVSEKNREFYKLFSHFTETNVKALERKTCDACCPEKKKANSKNVSCQTFPVLRYRNQQHTGDGKSSSSLSAKLQALQVNVEAENGCGSSNESPNSVSASGSVPLATRDCKTILDSIYKCLADAKQQ